MAVLDDLKDLRKVLEKKENWLQHQSSDDAGGFCLSGAAFFVVNKCSPHSPNLIQNLPESGNLGNFKRLMVLRGRLRDIIGDGIVHFNDQGTTTHPMILEVIDKAIAKEQHNAV